MAKPVYYENINRSVESWGPLANLPESQFNREINSQAGETKKRMKALVTKAKKLKTYKVSFIKEWRSEQFEIMAESEYDVSSKAREFFKDNAETIGFKESPGKRDYDRMSYVKVRS